MCLTVGKPAHTGRGLTELFPPQVSPSLEAIQGLPWSGGGETTLWRERLKVLNQAQRCLLRPFVSRVASPPRPAGGSTTPRRGPSASGEAQRYVPVLPGETEAQSDRLRSRTNPGAPPLARRDPRPLGQLRKHTQPGVGLGTPPGRAAGGPRRPEPGSAVLAPETRAGGGGGGAGCAPDSATGRGRRSPRSPAGLPRCGRRVAAFARAPGSSGLPTPRGAAPGPGPH